MIEHDGCEYVPSRTACERLDVGEDTLRNWYRPRGGRPARVRLLLDPRGNPVTWQRQVLVCWPDAVEAEHATRRHPRRPRKNP